MLLAARIAAPGLFVALLMAVVPPLNADEGADWFEAKVRPLLVARCLECHGETDPEAGLRLTSRAQALAGGENGTALVPGQPDQSRLIQAVRYQGDVKMPPSGKLPESEIAVLVEWVERGAPWPATSRPQAAVKQRRVTDADRAYWSFRPVLSKPVPALTSADGVLARWGRSPVDAFIAQSWQTAGATPGPAVDRRTLLRRLYLDLVGLPPSYEETVEFVEDPGQTDELVGRVIDRLLASPCYGERWGRHWLDVARFADTKDGVLMYGDDRIRPYAYTYRDYVIRAWNEDLPFDRFVQEQLAADLLEPQVEPWRLAALGLLTLGRMYDNNVHDIIDDQIDVVTRGFLGLTVACARCHDHKYDPIPMADYYSLYGVFASSESPLEPPLIDDPARYPGGVEFEKQAAVKREDLRKFVDDQYELLSRTARERTVDYLIKAATTKPDPLETAIFFLSLSPEDLRPPITARWRRLIEQRSQPDDPVFAPWLALMQIRGEPSEAGAFARQAAAVLEELARRPAGVEPGQVNPRVLAALRQATLSDRESVARAYGDALLSAYRESEQARTGAASSSPTVDDPARRQLADLAAGPTSPAYFPKSQTRRYMSRGETDAFGGKVKDIDLLAVRSPSAPPRAMSVQDAPASVEPRIFTRGNPSLPGRAVPRQFLEIASSKSRTPFTGVSGRLDLARAIASPDNPLTARVFVNRVWMEHFGEPLVSTPSDFGTRATPPLQVDLLDWLAGKWMREGWSIKSLHRELMTTSLYQLSAASNADSRASDPENRLLTRLPRRRLDWEAMRDTLLSASGRLELRGAGRPVDVAGDPTARVRTVYGLVDRQSLPGVFRAFDFATPDQSVERRPRTMVPQQALFALNSPFMIEQTKSLLARPEVARATTPEEKVRALYQTVLARTPEAEELREAVEFAAAKGGGSQLSRWELLGQTLLSCNELLYLD
ncbi:MAG: PSD1 and planctomycete cytochrome C domain-containing protein [Pirellulales bacterium]